MTEPRLIDADLAFETVVDLSGQADTKSAYAAYWKAGRAIQNLPTVDAVPVVHGRWMPTNDENKKRCSRCDVIHLIAQYPFVGANWCPSCGAKMDGGDEDGTAQT